MVMVKPIQAVMRSAVHSSMYSLTAEGEEEQGLSGAFSSAFSADFDLLATRDNFSSAFSSDFAIFTRLKQFSAAFSPSDFASNP